MLDAYTIKKMLPRLVIAVILVNLSWYICMTLFNTTSIIGNSIESLIWQPFENVNPPYSKGVSVNTTLDNLFGIGVVPATGIAAVWLVAGGGWAVILSLIASALGALAIAVIVLTLRELAIISLIIISPLALVLWVLPGTEQWTKRWWGLFSKLLLMFPAFLALRALGEVLSAVISRQNQAGSSSYGASIIEGAIPIIIYILPYFMLPFLFKMMGGFISQVTGMINDREKGLLDRTKNWSKEKRALSNQGIDKELRKQDHKNERRSSRIGAIASGSTLKQRSGRIASLGGRVPGVRNIGNLSETGMASLENAAIKEELEGLSRRPQTREQLMEIINDQSTAPARKKAAVLRAAQTQDLGTLQHMRSELSQTEEGRRLYDELYASHYDALNTASPGAANRLDGPQSIAQIQAVDAAAFTAMDDVSASKLSSRQWTNYHQADSAAAIDKRRHLHFTQGGNEATLTVGKLHADLKPMRDTDPVTGDQVNVDPYF